jgi:hypothetical protein
MGPYFNLYNKPVTETVKLKLVCGRPLQPAWSKPLRCKAHEAARSEAYLKYVATTRIGA